MQVDPLAHRSGPKPRQHQDEKLVDAIKEVFQRDVERLKEFLTINGRPLFTQRLTTVEELARFHDPVVRQQIMDDLDRREGPDAVRAWMERMTRLNEEYRTAFFGAASEMYDKAQEGR
jgi:hypothetical protein